MAATAPAQTLLDAALRYAQLGWAVFPLHSPAGGKCTCGADVCSVGKHPRTADGFKSATTDGGKIRGWWRTWPTANIGVATGAVSGIFVLDVDPDKGGDASLGMLLSEHGEIPDTVDAVTGSGGRHVVFAHPGKRTPNSTQRLGAGLDVRGDGGYIVVSPSLHRSGSLYEWQPQCAPWEHALAPAPAWLLELLAPPPAPSPRPPLAADNAYRRASAYLAKIPGATAGQRGHDQAWKAALAVVRGFRLSESEAFSLLASEYNGRCAPPWSDKELEHKVHSAMADASVPFGYLLERERERPAATRTPGEDDGEERKTRLGLQPVANLLAEQIPDTEWLLTPYLEVGTIAALVAPPNIGKTLLAFWLATQVKGRVAIIEEEGGKRGFRKRIERAMAAAGNPTNIDYSFKPRISLMNQTDVRALAAELKGYALVIIDSFARVTTGIEENDTTEVGLIIAALDYIREESGSTSLSLHHTGKSKWKPGEVPHLADGRGSSALAAGLDTVLALAPVEDVEPGVVKFELHITKQRDEDNQVPPRLVRIAMTGPSADVTMEEIQKHGRGPTPTEVRVAQLLPLVFAAIPEPPAAAITREMLQDTLGKRAADVRMAVAKLVDQKKVKELSRKRLIRVPSGYRERAE